MDKLIEALQIFLKYGNNRNPTCCEHDTLHICHYEWDEISKEDQVKLGELGFFECDGSIVSYKYGSC